jgi:drug/metabolite transporter (DMT)-like permease
MRVSVDGWLGLHGAVLLFALAGIVGKALAMPPVMIVAGRSTFAAITLFTLIAFQGQLRKVPRSGLLVVSGMVLAVHWATFFQAIDCAGVGVALVSYSTYPLALLVMEVCWYRTKPSLSRWIAGGLILIGMVFLVPELDVSNQAVIGAVWGIGSGALFALYTLTNRRLSHDQGPIAIAASQNAVSALCMADGNAAAIHRTAGVGAARFPGRSVHRAGAHLVHRLAQQSRRGKREHGRILGGGAWCDPGLGPAG